MKTYYECVPCFINQTLSTLRRITDDETIHERTLRRVLSLLPAMDFRMPPPAMAQQIYRIIAQISGNNDPFAREKAEHNRFALSLIPEIREKYQHDLDVFEKMVRLSIAGNIIDFGVTADLVRSDVLQSIDESMKVEIDREAIDRLQSALLESTAILYLGDNAGEIAFDRLFIEHLPYERLTYVVRGAPVINDVTIRDAEEVGMVDLVEVIDNGSDAPGTILNDCSKEFQERFESADVIIAKGQGNYETLSEVKKKIFFLFQVKCPVVARDTGCKVKSFIVKAQETDLTHTYSNNRSL